MFIKLSGSYANGAQSCCATATNAVQSDVASRGIAASVPLDAHQGALRMSFHNAATDRRFTHQGVNPMSREIMLDVRGMEPPEPLERVLETIDDFGPGDRLRLVIDCRPMPLFRILDRNGYAHREAPGANSNYEITIWRKDADAA
jgi:uncharacterized protein (DUF2249 family)